MKRKQVVVGHAGIVYARALASGASRNLSASLALSILLSLRLFISYPQGKTLKEK